MGLGCLSAEHHFNQIGLPNTHTYTARHTHAHGSRHTHKHANTYKTDSNMQTHVHIQCIKTAHACTQMQTNTHFHEHISISKQKHAQTHKVLCQIHSRMHLHTHTHSPQMWFRNFVSKRQRCLIRFNSVSGSARLFLIQIFFFILRYSQRPVITSGFVFDSVPFKKKPVFGFQEVLLMKFICVCLCSFRVYLILD